MAGPLVMLTEHNGSTIRRQLPFTLAEAEACAAALLRAVRELHAPAAMLAEGAPEPYRGPYPIRAHRTLAEVPAG